MILVEQKKNLNVKKKYVEIFRFLWKCNPIRKGYTTLEFNQYMKSDKMSYIIYTDIESLIKKKVKYANNPENSSTTKIGEHIENKHTLCCMQDGNFIIKSC